MPSSCGRYRTAYARCRTIREQHWCVAARFAVLAPAKCQKNVLCVFPHQLILRSLLLVDWLAAARSCGARAARDRHNPDGTSEAAGG